MSIIEKQLNMDSKKKTVLEYDELIAAVGSFGNYQRRNFFFICLASMVTTTFTMIMVFAMANVDHWCNVPQLYNITDNTTLIKALTLPTEKKDGVMQYSQCKRYVGNYSGLTIEDLDDLLLTQNKTLLQTESCTDGWLYDDSVYKSTLVTEFDLVCEKQAYTATSASLYMVGFMFGVMIFGTLSDSFGRKKAFSVSLLLSVAFSIGGSFTNSFISFAILRFLLGISCIGIFLTSFVLGIEIVGPEWRVFVGIAVEYFWAFGYLVLALGAYFLRDRFTLMLVFSVPSVLLIPFIWMLPESPRWLYIKNKKDQADEVIKTIAEKNGKLVPENVEVVLKKTDKAVYVWELFRYPNLRLRSLNIFFNWFVNSLVYYGLSLNSGNLGGNDYLNFAISGAVEIIAYLFCHATMDRLGRRPTLSGTMVTGGISLLLTMATNKNWIIVTLAMLGKACISASFAIIYVMTAELFPTVVRNAGVGAGSFCGRIGGILAPQIGLLGNISKFIPLVVFGVASLSAGLLALLLPETKGRTLPETLQEGEDYTKKSPQMMSKVNNAFTSDAEDNIKQTTKI